MSLIWLGKNDPERYEASGFVIYLTSAATVPFTLRCPDGTRLAYWSLTTAMIDAARFAIDLGVACQDFTQAQTEATQKPEPTDTLADRMDALRRKHGAERFSHVSKKYRGMAGSPWTDAAIEAIAAELDHIEATERSLAAKALEKDQSGASAQKLVWA